MTSGRFRRVDKLGHLLVAQPLPLSASKVYQFAFTSSRENYCILRENTTELYNVTAPTLSSANNSMGIYESGDTYAQADLNDFFKNEATLVGVGSLYPL